MQKGFVSSIFLICFLSVPMLYTNCGSQHQGTQQLSSTSILKPVFRDTFHPFLVSNCASCHYRGGSGNGKFASSSIDEAFDDFYYMGYQKIADYAVNPNHNYPFTGPQHEQEVNALINTYKDVIANNDHIEEDSNIYELDAQLVTSSKILGFNAEGKRTLLWNLKYNLAKKSDENLLEESVLENIEIISEAALVNNVTGQIGYSFGAPEIRVKEGAGTDIMVVGGVYQLNDGLVKKNTFYSLAACVREGESASLSTSGSIFYDRKYIESDRLSLHILSMTKTTCSPPEEQPKVSFEIAASEVMEGSPPALDLSSPASAAASRTARKNWAMQPFPSYIVKVVLDKAPKVTTYVSIARNDGESDGEMISRCCDTIGEDRIQVYRGLWDYQFNRADLVFYPPEEGEEPVLVKEIVIQVNDDERITDIDLEDDPRDRDNIQGDRDRETLVLELVDLVNAQPGTNMKHSFTIVNDDSLSESEEISFDPSYTYEGLYRNVFISEDPNVRCIECHNSVIRAKGYDITNYKHLISSEVVIPGDHTNSDMYRRIVLWEQLGLQPMPLNENIDNANNSIDTSWYRVIESWINSGAKNN